TLLHEANVLPGVANRLLGRKADAVCLGVGEAAAWIPAGRTLVTGNPVLADLDPMPAADARRRLGLAAERTTLLVTGGSLGSNVLNAWMASNPSVGDAQIVWQCGAANEAVLAAGSPNTQPRGFIGDMSAAYSAADVVVAAAGALTVAELAALNKAAVIVPQPNVTDGHQAKNAAALAARGVPVVAADQVMMALAGAVRLLLERERPRPAAADALAAAYIAGAAARIAAAAARLAQRRMAA